MELTTTNYYVTSRGSYKGTNGKLYTPGDIMPLSALPSEEVLHQLLTQGTLATDQAEAFKVQQPITQPALQVDQAGTDDEIQPPARGRANDAAARNALREAQRAADSKSRLDADMASRGAEIGVEVLGAGPVRKESEPVLPSAETDPSNLTINDYAGKNLTVEQYNAAKNN